ncbi:hypothetical protein RFI_25238 [Reticulomyxa filosa]|uniref:Uncharacterized protein n=1 Tax=Reticulomyxa filosa TaxID=46433 RepID=X6ME11_RETFI|nr:hypothetical protein RFI_25238 [Reticulomyxa filosa]|eukprot:ETO12139.1 hypothetical protein RFI_25238 [Reticulomyxa filosa]
MLITKATLTELQDRNLLRTDIDTLTQQLLTVQTDYSKFDTVDLVIESVLEHLVLKQSIIRDLYRHRQHWPKLPHDGNNRLVGMHFFAPAHLMNIIEIVKSRHTSPQVLADILVLSKRIDKIGVVVKDGTGFVANRMFYPYRQVFLLCFAADFLIEHGVDPYRMDRALEQFGMASGVNRMTDIAGIDVFYQGQESVRKDLGGRMYLSSMLKELSDRRRYGEKSGAGFYRYDEFHRPSTDYNGLDDVLESVRAGKSKIQFELTDQEIVEMLLFPVVNECFRIIAEKKIEKRSDLDVLSCQGYGFPTKYGGIFYWAQHIGFTEIAQRLEKWALLHGQGETETNAQAFFAPCEALLNAGNN